jgi:hypothetical protein
MTAIAPPVPPSTIGRLIGFTTLITMVRALIRILGFSPSVRLLASLPRMGTTLVAIDHRWASEIAMVAVPPLGGSCLDRSVLMWFVMRQHGLDGDLRIGVRREADGNGSADAIVAHAWVEHFGSVVNDSQDVASDYAVFDGDVTGLAFD